MVRHTAMTTAQTTSAMLRARNTMRPIARPTRNSRPSARNFSGASRKEIANTMPSHINVAAAATRMAISVMTIPD